MMHLILYNPIRYILGAIFYIIHKLLDQMALDVMCDMLASHITCATGLIRNTHEIMKIQRPGDP